ncbi:MAG: hypothetical protein ACM3MG_02805 [Bacillota bacterium]
MKTRLLLCCLMLGLTISKHSSTVVVEFASTRTRAEETTSSSTRDGFYSLVNGTQGCPQSIDWIEQCSGFVLDPHDGAESLATIHFCRINAGPQITRNEFGKSMHQVIKKNHYIQSIEKALFSNESITTAEDTIILDTAKQQFQWEHSQGGKGFSCLYAK